MIIINFILFLVPQKDIGSTTATNAIISHNSPQVVDENSKDALVSSGDTARRVVSGLYTLSKMSWQMVQPFLSHSNSKSSSKHSPSTTSRPQPEVGGGILVLDLESYQSSQPEDQNDLKERKSLDHTHILETLPIITHFVSHQGESLSIMAFSPTGLKLASVDTHGQVIFVHALVPSGLTSHSHQVVGLLNPNRPYLLYKLVRGLTLAKIVDIGFDLSESIAFASSINGTVHIFDLNSTTTESNEIKSTPSSWQDAGTSPLNPLNLLGINGFSASSMSNGHNHHNLNGHNHNHANLRSNLENQVPLINVSQFLQLHKPDLRTLHGYSELKIKLPLRESPFQEQSHGNISKRDEINNGEDDSNRDRLSSDSDSLHTSNTSFFHEVNMSSCTVFLPYINYFSGSDSAIESGAANRFEILISSSEGIISRYQLTLKSVNGNQIIPNSLRELNRWDLCYPLTTSNYVPSQGASNLNSNKFTSSTSWISAVGNRIDHIVDIPPVWMRPQCTLRRFRLDGEGKFSDRLPQNPISNTTTSTSHPISIESFAAAELRRSTPSHRSPILQDSSSTSEKGELSENQIFFFPERISTTLLKVDRHDFRDLTLNIGEKIHAAILTNLPEISDSESKHNIVITKHIDDITAWEMDDEWNGS